MQAFSNKKGVKNPIWLNRLLIGKWDEIKEKTIAEIKKLNPDAIIHCGDFTHFGTKEDFVYGKEILDAAGIEWYAVPGNHDSFTCDVKDEMRNKYDMAAGGGFHYSKLFGRIAVLFLDVCASADGKHFSIDDRIRIYNKALESLNLREDSIIKEWNNKWAAGTQEARDAIILF